MRNLTSYTIATLLSATLLATPVLANDSGHHTKQSDPSYWNPSVRQMDESTKAVDAPVKAEKAEQTSDKGQKDLAPSAHRHNYSRAPLTGEVQAQ